MMARKAKCARRPSVASCGPKYSFQRELTFHKTEASFDKYMGERVDSLGVVVWRGEVMRCFGRGARIGASRGARALYNCWPKTWRRSNVLSQSNGSGYPRCPPPSHHQLASEYTPKLLTAPTPRHARNTKTEERMSRGNEQRLSALPSG